jgi:VanZ family protein
VSRGAWLAALAWAAGILVATSIPGRDLPRAFPGADKLVHLVIYGVLGALVGRALRADERRGGARGPRLVVWIGALALFAAFDEWHQDLIPGRSTDRIDWLADMVGATTGLVVATTSLRSEQRT